MLQRRRVERSGARSLPELDSGDLHVGTVVVNVTDMQRAVSFWSQVLGYRTWTSPAGCAPGDPSPGPRGW